MAKRNKKTNEVLIIDGDILVYQAADAAQQAVNWNEYEPGCDWHGLWSVWAFEQDGIEIMTNKLRKIQEATGVEEYVFCLSASNNFRYDVDPTYKKNRTPGAKPVIFGALRDWASENLHAETLPRVEADDLIGILATGPYKGRGIVVSEDKDLKQIPGMHFNPAKDEKVRGVTLDQAEDYFWSQALSGDATDGYGGCTGWGPKRAEEWAAVPFRMEMERKVISRGPRKGEVVLEPVKVPCGKHERWPALVSIYEAAGQTADDALTTARLAKILWDGEYDYERKYPILWEPNT